jgi:DNA-binding transcriptional LysR family regulator
LSLSSRSTTASSAFHDARRTSRFGPSEPKEGDLWGRKLADVAWAVYGAKDRVAANNVVLASSDDLGRHGMIGWEETAVGIQAVDWLNRNVAAESFVYRTNSLVNQMVAAKAGIGLALLPCYLGDRVGDLARALPDPVPELAGELWIVTHSDLKRTARVRAFFDIVGEAIASERALFEGRG